MLTKTIYSFQNTVKTLILWIGFTNYIFFGNHGHFVGFPDEQKVITVTFDQIN